jgi:dihydroxyacetone kinase
MCTAAEAVKIILEAIVGTLKLKSEDEIVVFVNNLGSTSQLEQWLVTGEVHKQFSKHLKILALLVKCGSSSISEIIPQEQLTMVVPQI